MSVITESGNFYTATNGQFRLRQFNLTASYRLRQTKKKEGFELEH